MWDTAHFFSFSVEFCVVLPSCYRWEFQSLDFFSSPFPTVLVLSCFSVLIGHQRRHIIINVSRSKCDYFVFSVFNMEACVLLMKCILLLWQDGWSVQSYVKPHLFSSSWEMYLLLVAFEQLVQRVFWNRGISLQVQTVVAVYTVCCITPFCWAVSELRWAAYTMYNSLTWTSFQRTDDREYYIWWMQYD